MVHIGNVRQNSCIIAMLFISAIIKDGCLSGHPDYVREMIYDKIMQAIVNDEVDAGLIIHESRFTYEKFGLQKIIDLGEWWEEETHLPIPLGGIIMKKEYTTDIKKRTEDLIRRSIQYSYAHKDEAKTYIKEYAQELEDDVIDAHIQMFVNSFSLDLGETGSKAINKLLQMGEEKLDLSMSL